MISNFCKTYLQAQGVYVYTETPIRKAQSHKDQFLYQGYTMEQELEFKRVRQTLQEMKSNGQ